MRFLIGLSFVFYGQFLIKIPLERHGSRGILLVWAYHYSERLRDVARVDDF